MRRLRKVVWLIEPADRRIERGSVVAAAVQQEVEGYARGRVPREVRERQVLTLAEELFLERGFQGMSMEELARRAGVSKPVVYDLFGSKERLFELCVARAGDELEVAVAEAVAGAGAEGIRAQVRAGGLAFFRFVEHRRRVWEVLLSSGAAPFAARVDDIRQRQNRLVTALIVAHAREPVDPVQVAAAAACINGAYEGMATWWQDHPDRTPDELADWIAGLVGPGLELAAATKEES
jgi:AcrR family transcriptional regulator